MFKKQSDLWQVRKVYYMTYAQMHAAGGYKDHHYDVVARRLSFKKARELVEHLGFPHSMHPETPNV